MFCVFLCKVSSGLFIRLYVKDIISMSRSRTGCRIVILFRLCLSSDPEPASNRSHRHANCTACMVPPVVKALPRLVVVGLPHVMRPPRFVVARKMQDGRFASQGDVRRHVGGSRISRLGQEIVPQRQRLPAVPKDRVEQRLVGYLPLAILVRVPAAACHPFEPSIGFLRTRNVRARSPRQHLT